MAIKDAVLAQLAVRFEVLLPHLNERQRRLALATEARLLGHGGVRAVARIAGASESTVRRGVFELEAGGELLAEGRIRRPGGGRKTATELDPGLLPALLGLVEPDERGDPMSPLRWTTKSLRRLAAELTRRGHRVSPVTVGRLLRENGFSLQANAKTLEGDQHPDRDAQFHYINDQVKVFQAAGEPVISVDAKKKEMLGQLPNTGREWRPKGEPVRVEDHSFFTGLKGETAIPYGVYDLAADTGWVSVGVDHNTSAFAVATIRRWWQARGQLDYPAATRLLITADAGGSNSYRYRGWKAELAALAADTGMAITVCHFPPGTSKWNKIEHRLFSHITMNWRGRPLTSHEVIVNAIASTTTRSGLRVRAELDTRSYPLGVAISKARMKALPLEPYKARGSWNYTLHPAPLITTEPSPPGSGPTSAVPGRRKVLDMLDDPGLTGMSATELDDVTARPAPAQEAERERRCFQQRGGPRRKAAADHGKPLFTGRDRILLTLLYLRQVCPQRVLAEMLEVTDRVISPVITETRRLLDGHKVKVEPTTLLFTDPDQLIGFLDTGVLPARSRTSLPEELCDPALTGMSRTDLQELIERLAPRQAAFVEGRRHTQRGRPRQPGTRGGVFAQKITDPERVLATVLFHRRVCTGEVLAELFRVNRSTIGNAFRDVRPLLDADGFHLPPAPFKHHTAESLLASIAATKQPS
ncbi:ISAzo13 family transposase [Streptomyces sp. MUM 2J]|uniref:ISAzo13 family transposase n=1 Tax=Streptomyces sp. MUM 2J TaxID=2791987 RepID=UPI001F04E288|nr:ISAzo13 family transposase [Streptomyces sp. MUM 2J]MCH0563897.1 ISAzo13 family transposase [Streptomyces sp. MUM 2J]